MLSRSRSAELLIDPRLRVRQSVIVALGESRDPRAITHLEALFEGGAEIRPLVIQAFGRLGDEDRLQEILRDPKSSKTDRVFAMTALEELGRG